VDLYEHDGGAAPHAHAPLSPFCNLVTVGWYLNGGLLAMDISSFCPYLFSGVYLLFITYYGASSVPWLADYLAFCGDRLRFPVVWCVGDCGRTGDCCGRSRCGKGTHRFAHCASTTTAIGVIPGDVTRRLVTVRRPADDRRTWAGECGMPLTRWWRRGLSGACVFLPLVIVCWANMPTTCSAW